MLQASSVRDQVPEDSLAVYLEEIGRTPLLTADEEVSLAQRIEAGRKATARMKPGLPALELRELAAAAAIGERARTRFLESNTRLVVSIAKKYRNARVGVDLVDLIQEGNLGLLRAVDKFDWRRGFKFSTYATWWIRQAITRALQEKGRVIRIPPRLHDAVLKVRSVGAELQAEQGRLPTVAELVERSGLEERRVVAALGVAELASLESPIGEDGAVLGDLIVTDDDPLPEDQVIDLEVADRLRQAIGRLDDREQLIIRHRFGLDDGEPRTRNEIGHTVGVTPERIGQIEKVALTKIRHPAFGLLERDFSW